MIDKKVIEERLKILEKALEELVNIRVLFRENLLNPLKVWLA